MSVTSDLLLVEDDLLLARALSRSLGTRGIRARHVARCATAAALRGPFAVGIFDVELPDGDGIELARLLAFRRVVGRVLFYTACSEPRRLARARDLGAVFAKSGNLAPLIGALTWNPAAELVVRERNIGSAPRV